MSEIRNRVHLNSHDVPVRKDGESEADFEARMEYFRKNDLRIVVPGTGKKNFAFDYYFTVGNGVISNGDDKPLIKMQGGRENLESISYNPERGGSFSVKGL